MSHDAHDHGHDAHHGPGPKIYFATFAALMILMAITVAVAFVPLGYFNLPVALTIAVIKTVLIIMFFMEVKYGTKLLWVFVASGFLFLLIMFFLTMNDYLTRDWYPAPM
jgi:cytochrome c oxidase subunit 4